MTKEEAAAIALRHASRKGGPPVAIVDEKTIERPFGWVFFYQSRKFLETGDSGHALLGNAAIIVNRETGRISTATTGIPVEDVIEAYEALGAAHFDAGGWRQYVDRKRRKRRR